MQQDRVGGQEVERCLPRETDFTAAAAVGGNTLFLPRTPCIFNHLRLYNVHPQKVEWVGYLLCCKGTGSGGLAI